ncbi:hypothetical protein OsJ_09450 [Oryza sativa Japonica Group]|uniref:FAD dependent oxidoreductase domain-containing protein n=1 Tax=Oryza sativa subsp. japonica TaxID=39947 RepID=B9FBE0_ORYSJ|nr:hypothetical protein OsJ_09450 [Oryza sativa Japonica Group]
MAPTVLQQKEAGEEDVVVVVVGAGIAGLAVALGLHRKGVKCRVLESSPELRASGFAIATWRNALQALDALGVAGLLFVHGRDVTYNVSQCAGETVRWHAQTDLYYTLQAVLTRRFGLDAEDPTKCSASGGTGYCEHLRKSYPMAQYATPPKSLKSKRTATPRSYT